MMQSSNVVDSKVEDFREDNGDAGNRNSVEKFPNGVKLERTSTPSSYDVNMMDVNGLGVFNGMNQIEPHRAIDPDSLLTSHLQSSVPNRTASSGSILETNNDEIKANNNDMNIVVQNVTQNDGNDNKQRKNDDRRTSTISATANEQLENNPSVSHTVRSQQMQKSQSDIISHANQVIPNGILENKISPGSAESSPKTELLFTSSSKTRNYSVEYSFKKIKPAYLIDSNGFLEYTKVFILFFLNLFVLVPFVTILALIFMPYKLIIRIFYKILHMCHLTRTSYISPEQVPEFLNPTELFWLYDSGLNETDDIQSNMTASMRESKSGFQSKSACLFLFDGCLSKNKIRELVKNRIVESSVHLNKFERFKQRIMNLHSLGFVWIKCTTFDLDEHILEIDSGINFETSEQMQSYLSNVISCHKFDLSKPLWSLYYKQMVNNKTERSTMILFISHQAFSDGLSLMRLFLRGLVDNRNQLDIKPRFAHSILRRTQLKQLLFGWSSLFYKLFIHHRPAKNESAYLKRSSSFQATGDAAPNTSTYHSTPNVLLWSDAFDLMSLNRLKLITRSKMNDFLVSVVSGILRQYLQSKGINNPNNLRCLVSVDLHSNKYPVKMNGRKSTFCSFDLPVKVEGCVPRLWATKCTTQALKRSSDFFLVHFMIRVLFKIFPNKFAYRCIRSVLNENSCVISTLGCGDSSLATVSVANQTVKNLIYFSPTVANVAVSFSIITYGDEVRLAMLADSGVISNPEFITKQFIKQLTLLSDLLSNRRIPGEIKKGSRIPADFDHLYAHPLMDANQMDDYAVNDVKLSQIQQELQQLSESLDNLDPAASDYNKKRQVILIKSDKLRKDFTRMLAEMRSRSSQISQAIPSDDEDELEPDERIRLRSSSVASRVSGNSHSRRFLRDSHSEHSNVDRPMSSRKASLAQNSRHGSLSYSSGNSHSREFSHNHGNSNLNLHNINHHSTVSTERETNRSPRRSMDHN